MAHLFPEQRARAQLYQDQRAMAQLFPTVALYWGCCCLLLETSSMEEQPSSQPEDLILLTILSGGLAVVVTKPNQLMRIILDKGWLTVNRFGSVSKASARLRLGF